MHIIQEPVPHAAQLWGVMSFFLSAFYLALVVAARVERQRCDEQTPLHLFLVYAPGAVWLFPVLLFGREAWMTGAWGALVVNVFALWVVVFGLMGLRINWRQALSSVWRGGGAAGATPRAVSGPSLRVATYNVFGGCIDIGGCVRFLRECGAEVIFLQEAWWTHPGSVDTLASLHEAFAGWHMVRSEHRHEMMILSRHALSDVAERLVADRPSLVCTAHTPLGDVRLVNVHLSPPATHGLIRQSRIPVVDFFLEAAGRRREQGDALVALVSESRMPSVVAGDFNSPPHAYARRVLRPLLRDAFERGGRGFGYTFPRAFPLWRIDYILVSPSVEARFCLVGRSDGSDHRPLVADLVMAREDGNASRDL